MLTISLGMPCSCSSSCSSSSSRSRSRSCSCPPLILTHQCGSSHVIMQREGPVGGNQPTLCDFGVTVSDCIHFQHRRKRARTPYRISRCLTSPVKEQCAASWASPASLKRSCSFTSTGQHNLRRQACGEGESGEVQLREHEYDDDNRGRERQMEGLVFRQSVADNFSVCKHRSTGSAFPCPKMRSLLMLSSK